MKELVIDPIFAFEKTSLMITFRKKRKYNPLLILPILFEKCYVDKNLLLEMVEHFDNPNYPIFERLFECGKFVDLNSIDVLRDYHVDVYESDKNPPYQDNFFAIKMMREIKKIGLIIKSFNWLSYEISMAHYNFSKNKNLRFQSISDMKSLLLNHLSKNKHYKELMFVKETTKLNDSLYFLIDQIAPNFEIDSKNEEAYFKLIKENNILFDFLIKLIDNFGGFYLTDGNKTFLSEEISRVKKQISIIDDKIEIQGKTGKKIGAISSILLPLPVLSNLLGLVGDEITDFLLEGLKSKQLQEKELDWFAYLDSFKIFQSLEKPEPKGCKLCNISYEEAKEFTDKEATQILLGAADMCIAHNIMILNFRKIIAPGIYGKALLLAIKKNESNPSYRLGTPLG